MQILGYRCGLPLAKQKEFGRNQASGLKTSEPPACRPKVIVVEAEKNSAAELQTRDEAWTSDELSLLAHSQAFKLLQIRASRDTQQSEPRTGATNVTCGIGWGCGLFRSIPECARARTYV